MSIEQIIENAKAGRGLWAGLKLGGTWSNDWARFLPEKPHVTLVHLGKENDEERVRRLVDACTNATDILELRGMAFEVELTGFGILYRHSGRHTPIGLINSATVTRLREVVFNGVHDLVSDRYGFIPHVTMDAAKMESMGHGIHQAWSVLSSSRASKLMTWGVEVFCGDAHFLCNDVA